MRHLIKAIGIAFLLYLLLACVRRIDPKLLAVLLPADAQHMTIFASGVPDSHKVCITTLRIQDPLDCVSFGRLKLFIQGVEKARDRDSE